MSNYNFVTLAQGEALSTVLCNAEDTTWEKFTAHLQAEPFGYPDYDLYTPWEPFTDMNNTELLSLLEGFASQFNLYAWRVLNKAHAVEADEAWEARNK